MNEMHNPQRGRWSLQQWADDATIKDWIASPKLDTALVDWVDDLGKILAHDEMTPTSLRNFFGEVRNIQAKGFTKSIQRFMLLRPKLAYTSGKLLKSEKAEGNSPKAREKAEKNAAENQKGLHKFVAVMTRAHGFVDTSKPEQFDRFVELMEAIVAYHKLYFAPIEKKSNRD